MPMDPREYNQLTIAAIFSWLVGDSGNILQGEHTCLDMFVFISRASPYPPPLATRSIVFASIGMNGKTGRMQFCHLGGSPLSPGKAF